MGVEPIGEVIKRARASVRNSKALTPFIHPEYHRLEEAKRKYYQAKLELESAQLAWDNLGSSRALPKA